jgi:osmotically-inducible protein OsmY
MTIRHHFAAAILVALGVLITSAPAMAADDATIRDAVEKRFEKKELLKDANVRVQVSDGEVTLSGVATNLPLKRELEKQARKEAKVVHNRVQVKLEEPAKDSEIIDGVRSAILRYPFYDIFDYVEFRVKDGAVLLEGSVIAPHKKKSIEDRVARVPGLTALRNDIKVQSFSGYDSDLRYSLAQRIYGDPRFVQYGARSHPPIRILVDRGHVTLAGWVSSPVEKAVLESIARSSLSFSVTNNLRVDGELPEEDGGQTQDESTRS